MIILLIQLNQKPKTPDPLASMLNHTLSDFPLILQRPQPRQTHTCTHTSHRYEYLSPLSSSPPGKTITAHHTSSSNLTRNLRFGAKQALPQMIPRVTSSAESLIQTQCQHYLTIKLQSRFSRFESGNQITTHYDQTSFGFPCMKPIQTDVLETF